MRKCPSCDSSYRKRISRNIILKLIPKSKLYKCYNCKTNFMHLPFISFLLIIKKGVKKSDNLIKNYN